MKAIINGKRYDTETAEIIGEASFGNYGDFSRWTAGLYRTKNGRYFLAGTGGPMTIYAYRTSDGGRSGGSAIIPLDKVNAYEWAERYLMDSIVEKHFGNEIEDA